jgi:hypothetical protein
MAGDTWVSPVSPHPPHTFFLHSIHASGCEVVSHPGFELLFPAGWGLNSGLCTCKAGVSTA